MNALFSGHPPFATVAIRTAYERPPFQSAFVQSFDFAVYDTFGRRVNTATLDKRAYNSSIPGNCLVCHGGTYSTSTRTVTGARLLPFDFTAVKFDPARFPSYTRASLEEPFRQLNEMVYDQRDQSDAIRELVRGWYGGETGLRTPGSVQNDLFVPAGWNGSAQHRKFYLQAIRPACRACHVAISIPNAPEYTFTSYKHVTSSALTPLIVPDLCKTHVMPNAERTMGKIWELGVRQHFLSLFGLKSEACHERAH
jgi:hypothetical protein